MINLTETDENPTETGEDKFAHNYTESEMKELSKKNSLRAEELLKQFDLGSKPKNTLLDRVTHEIERRKIIKYGSNDLPAGPDIYDANSIILVEGRADVINLMKMGIDNSIALEGTSVPHNVIHLCNEREVTALLDGDRGGDMILKELLLKTQIEYIARAPNGKEIEHLNRDELQEILENHKKSVLDAEFVNERISLVDFLKRNNRNNYLK